MEIILQSRCYYLHCFTSRLFEVWLSCRRHSNVSLKFCSHMTTLVNQVLSFGRESLWNTQNSIKVNSISLLTDSTMHFYISKCLLWIFLNEQ